MHEREVARVGVVTTSYPRGPDDPAGSFVADHVAWLRRQGLAVDVVCAGDQERPHRAWQDGVNVIPVQAPGELFYRGGAPDLLERVLARTPNTKSSLHFAGRAQRLRDATTSLCFPRPKINAGSSLRFFQAARSAVYFCAVMTATVHRHIERWDAIFAHWLVPSALTAALSKARRRGADQAGNRFVAVAHSGDVNLICNLGIASLVARVLRAKGARLVFVSQSLRRRFLSSVHGRSLRAWLQASSTVTPMGIDLARFRPLQARQSGPTHPFRILFLGRLVPIKGVDVLLQAIASVQSRHPIPLQLTIAGDGPHRAALERDARELASHPRTAIEFLGQVTPGQRDELLARAHVLVLPSVPRPDGRTEGMPVTALEAMAAGTPLIASRTGGLAELPDRVATLVPPMQPAALARALVECERDPLAREHRAAAAAGYVQRFDWDRIGPRLWSGSIDPTI